MCDKHYYETVIELFCWKIRKKMAESDKKCFEFLNPNAKTVVVFNREIQASDVTECIRHCVDNKFWPENSNVIILSGHHTSSEGKLGAT